MKWTKNNGLPVFLWLFFNISIKIFFDFQNDLFISAFYSYSNFLLILTIKFSNILSGMVLHAMEDDFNPERSTSSTGMAGARVGCCLIDPNVQVVTRQ